MFYYPLSSSFTNQETWACSVSENYQSGAGKESWSNAAASERGGWPNVCFPMKCWKMPRSLLHNASRAQKISAIASLRIYNTLSNFNNDKKVFSNGNLYFLVCWFLSFQNSSTHSLLLLYYDWHTENNPIDFRSWDKENICFFVFWADFQKYFHIGTLVH